MTEIRPRQHSPLHVLWETKGTCVSLKGERGKCLAVGEGGENRLTSDIVLRALLGLTLGCDVPENGAFAHALDICRELGEFATRGSEGGWCANILGARFSYQPCLLKKKTSLEQRKLCTLALSMGGIWDLQSTRDNRPS